ncbi:tetratricopeptide repeat protein [Calothrix sp. CCY 0018]|uniref:tetratricopeptide repeat protein n=1 Tax=Calothrix sp. CCY 0018 TaxID=3103864 RepID=UPI0039C67956
MIDKVASAFEKKDYRTAANLLKQLLKESPDNHQVQLYVGKLHEVSGKHEKAEKVYRQLLRDSNNNKIITQARLGLQRLEQAKTQLRQQVIAQTKSNPENQETAVLILEPIASELKQEAAQKLASILGVDAYSARLSLPSRGWRLYRSGALGELKFYGEQLSNSGIPCFWTPLTKVNEIEVFQVHYFKEFATKVTVVCENQDKQLGSLVFEWSEVTAQVQGLLPIFEEVVDLNARGKLQRKTQTQDYFHFCDLHIPVRNCILRIYDNGYKFNKGVAVSPQTSQNTIRINWNNLLNYLKTKLPQVKIWSDFTPFAETMLDQTDVLHQIESHIQIFRREKSSWDKAFGLYSSLIFVKGNRE